MCAITRRGHCVEERESCVKDLYVKRDLRRREDMVGRGSEAYGHKSSDTPSQDSWSIIMLLEC